MPFIVTLRRLRPALCLWLLLPLGATGEVRPGDGSAAGDSAKIPGIDQAAVHAFYLEGEFDSVLARIHGFRKDNPDHSRGDSLFIARHLAVVLAANPTTVEAGKYWMHHLLILSPGAGLEGMYVSEAIEEVFRRVKREGKGRSDGSVRRKWLWIGAAGTVLAAGAAAWLLLDDDSDRKERATVPVTL